MLWRRLGLRDSVVLKAQETGYQQIFIEILPMDSLTASDKPPVVEVLFRSIP